MSTNLYFLIYMCILNYIYYNMYNISVIIDCSKKAEAYNFGLMNGLRFILDMKALI